jgi:hypothetical protein
MGRYRLARWLLTLFFPGRGLISTFAVVLGV